jgi:hypothetical protein
LPSNGGIFSMPFVSIILMAIMAAEGVSAVGASGTPFGINSAAILPTSSLCCLVNNELGKMQLNNTTTNKQVCQKRCPRRRQGARTCSATTLKIGLPKAVEIHLTKNSTAL